MLGVELNGHACVCLEPYWPASQLPSVGRWQRGTLVSRVASACWSRNAHVRCTISRVTSTLHLCQWGRASAGSKHADATLTLSKLGCSRPRRCVRICRTQYELPIRQHLGECCSATCVSVRQENGQDIDVTWFPLPGCRCCSAICFECECCVPGTQADTAVEHVETGPLKATRYLLLAGAGSLPIPPGRFGCF